MKTNLCPCGTGRNYRDCCGAIHQNPKLANHPEQLMRARYTAHAQRNMTFIDNSWHPSTRPLDMASVASWNDTCHWMELSVSQSRRLGKKGIVEFGALYRQAGKLQQHHEVAQFILDKGQWWYVGRD